MDNSPDYATASKHLEENREALKLSRVFMSLVYLHRDLMIQLTDLHENPPIRWASIGKRDIPELCDAEDYVNDCLVKAEIRAVRKAKRHVKRVARKAYKVYEQVSKKQSRTKPKGT